MRTAQCVWLVAGSVMLHAAAAVAGEGSSLRGIKPPVDALERFEAGTSEPGLKWRDVELPQHGSPTALYSGAWQTLRFSSGNTRSSMALRQPLGRTHEARAAELDRLHDAVPKYTLERRISQALPGGWGLGFGVRQTEYNFHTGNLLSFSAEHYIGNFRGAYTLYSNTADGSSLGSAHRFQVNYFYGARNTVGLAYTTGRDIEHVGLGIGIPAHDVRDLSLSGRHWLSPNWAVTYDVLSQEQALLKRQGLRLGVSRSF